MLEKKLLEEVQRFRSINKNASNLNEQELPGAPAPAPAPAQAEPVAETPAQAPAQAEPVADGKQSADDILNMIRNRQKEA